MIQDLSSKEQEKVTALFNKFGVDYMAAGDFAMRKYVDGKYFNNVQLWVKPTPDNFQKVQDAFASVKRKFDVPQEDFMTQNAESPLFKVGKGHKTVELYTNLPGMSVESFNQAFANRKVLNAGNVPVPILSEKDLHKTLQKSPSLSQAADLQMLERALPNLNPTMPKRTNITQVIDWQEASRTMDPHRVLKDLGFTHMPNKGLFNSSKSQTFERGEDRITVYPNPTTKPIFIDQMSGKRGDVIDLLNWQFNYDRKEVNRVIKDHFNGMAPTQQLGGTPIRETPTKAPLTADKPALDDKTLAGLQAREIKENYAVKSNLTSPGYLESRGLSLGTIFRPEFFKQAVNSLGWSSKEQKTVNIENTAFPLRNDYGVTAMIIRNANFKGHTEGERKDAIWLSNPPLTLNGNVRFGEGDKAITLPKGTEGTLVPSANKPDHYQFYYVDPAKKDQALPYNKVEVSGKALAQLTSAMNPLAVNRLVVTESPIDAMSFHQLSPPKAGESRMYLSTGGQPSEKQMAYINQVVQRMQPSQVVLANDNEKAGTKFNMNLMGAIQHPAISPQNQILARLTEVPPRVEKLNGQPLPGPTPPGEYQLKLFGVKDAQEMEKMALKMTDAMNRFTPKGQEPAARISLISSAPGNGTEITIAFPKNDRFLGVAQKQLEKAINEQAPGEVMKVVKPITKDFTQDLEQSKEQNKPKYDLDRVPPYLKTQAKNLYQQLTGYANNAFDALFGGVPGTLPKVLQPPKPEKKEELKVEEKKTNALALTAKTHPVPGDVLGKGVVPAGNTPAPLGVATPTKEAVSAPAIKTVAEVLQPETNKKASHGSAAAEKNPAMTPQVDKKESSLISTLAGGLTVVTKELLNSLQPPGKTAEQKQPEQKKDKSQQELEKVLVESERKGMKIR